MCMYVCVCVCMYVFMYVCMYVCMHVRRRSLWRPAKLWASAHCGGTSCRRTHSTRKTTSTHASKPSGGRCQAANSTPTTTHTYVIALRILGLAPSPSSSSNSISISGTTSTLSAGIRSILCGFGVERLTHTTSAGSLMENEFLMGLMVVHYLIFINSMILLVRVDL